MTGEAFNRITRLMQQAQFAEAVLPSVSSCPPAVMPSNSYGKAATQPDLGEYYAEQLPREKLAVVEHMLIVERIALTTTHQAENPGQTVGEALLVIKCGTGCEVGNREAQNTAGPANAAPFPWNIPILVPIKMREKMAGINKIAAAVGKHAEIARMGHNVDVRHGGTVDMHKPRHHPSATPQMEPRGAPLSTLSGLIPFAELLRG